MQKILIAILPVFLAVALIAPPAFGAFLDHHFAERQPYHAHLGAGGGHEHEYRREHSHARADSPDSRAARGADGDEAMPNPEIASSAMAAVRLEPGAATPTAAADSERAAGIRFPSPSTPRLQLDLLARTRRLLSFRFSG